MAISFRRHLVLDASTELVQELLADSKVGEGEMTIKIKFVFFEGGIGGREENRPKKRCFSWETP